MNHTLISGFIILGVVTMASGQEKNASPTKVTGRPTTTSSSLQYWDIVVGTGATAVAGKTVRSTTPGG